MNYKSGSNELHNGNDNSSYLFAQIGSSKYNLKDAVKLPAREDFKEWIANNIFDFHKQICMLFGTISEYCTEESCPKMTAGKRYEYLYPGPTEPVACPASKYIHLLLDWVQEQLDDESVFPCSIDKKFPDNYVEICETIAKRLFRVYAHIYHHHLSEVRMLKEEAHMNTSLKHFIYFVQEFNLVKPNELDPLKEFTQSFT